MIRKAIGFILVFIIFLGSIYTVDGRTRLDSVQNFLETQRISDEGFAETNQDYVDVITSSRAIEISIMLQLEIDNPLDILLFYQESQNSDGGFGLTPDDPSSWDATVASVSGLINLEINSSQLNNWQIFEYMNSSALDLLYANATNYTMRELNPELMKNWIEFILTSANLNSVPSIPIIDLIDKLKNNQLPNGSYSNFDSAVTTIQLLGLMGEVPNDPYLAAMFIEAHLQNDWLFSSSKNQPSTLEDTFRGLVALSQLKDIAAYEHTSDIVNQVLELQHSNSGFAETTQDSVTVQATYYAIGILAIFNKISELFTPDILQQYGFISLYSISMMLSILLVGSLLHRRNRFE